MCGLAGFVEVRGGGQQAALEALASQMADALQHRGPDDKGVWADPEAGIALGHRRLSILDLSPAGHQPMFSPSGRFVIVYNGEIYNCEHLRQELLSERPELHFHGHSDTEVMLAAFEHWGIYSALERMNGMFAFALWDRCERALMLARDRFGEKPLYYGSAGGTFMFASELKSLRVHPAFRGEIDRDAVACYLRFNCIPAPYSIYRDIRKLLPGTVLRYRNGEVSTQAFWSLRSSVERALVEPFLGTEEQAKGELDHLLRDAVKLRMHADVPLGAFLSGGIDSSLIVALMQAQSDRPVRTFSIGFREKAYDEAEDARAVARHLGTDHTELYVSSAEAIDLVSRLPDVYDEPFADSSQIPTLLVSQLTRRHVTVSLSGDAGDEVFGGYNRYTWGGRLWNGLERSSRSLRRLAAAGMTAVGPQLWDAAFKRARPLLPKSWRQRMPGYKMHKLAGLLASEDPMEMYASMASHWFEPERVVAGATALRPLHMIEDQWLKLPEFEQQAMYLDTITYLPNDILVKLDRATMAVGLEGRIPYLDPRVVEFAWRLPLQMKVRPNQGKWILRQVLYRYVPENLVERPKMGFGVPLDSWLRGPMREWAEALLAPRRLQEEGFFDPAAVRQKWDDHLHGRGAWQFHLWDILMFQLWWDRQNSMAKPQPRVEPMQVGA
jgi:asparagine synthase (glutamine-hydrolysing)